MNWQPWHSVKGEPLKHALCSFGVYLQILWNWVYLKSTKEQTKNLSCAINLYEHKFEMWADFVILITTSEEQIILTLNWRGFYCGFGGNSEIWVDTQFFCWFMRGQEEVLLGHFLCRPPFCSVVPDLEAKHVQRAAKLQLGSVSNPSEAACCLALRRRFSMLVVLLLRLPGRLPGAACNSGLFHTCWACDRVW